MTGKVLSLENIISPDLLATRLTERWIQWETLRQQKKNDWEEIKRYIYATDTSQTSNNKNPWKNSTTIPKLCQIMDNLYANYTATLFPKRKWLTWEANEQSPEQLNKAESIVNYMTWCIEQPMFKHEIDKIILDYIQYGNCFGTVEWVDQRTELADGKTQVGFVGPCIRRISPLDITMNPTAENFIQSPKMIRSIMSMGELKEMLERLSNDQNRDTYKALYDYLKDIRYQARTFEGDWSQQDNMYKVDGFTSFRAYLMQDYVEVLTFYGDWYDTLNHELQKNRIITVVDRHKLIDNKANPSFFGYPPIFHCAWRKRQDNLWGMGPLDNLVGMQYRLDHIENMKADIFDLTAYPVQKVKGFVEDFVWQPGEKIYVSEEGDVELVQPDVQALNANMEIEYLVSTMEQMAGAPREAMGFRSPGEKTKYEVQRMENAASRIYQNKIYQFSDSPVEPLLNGMLELARRNMVGSTTIKVFDDQLKFATFQTLTVDDITGVGRIKPVAARHFAEQAELVQNLTSLTQSQLWPFIQPHFSSLKLAKLIEKTLDIEEYDIVMPNVAVVEQADTQRLAQSLQEGLMQQQTTATGMGQDFDMEQLNTPPQTQGP